MKLLLILTLSLSANAGNIGVGNTYVDEVNSVFDEDCKIISDQSIKDAVVAIADQYQAIAHRSDPKCAPEAVAPDLNNLVRGPVCDFLGSQRTNYDFCKPRPTDPNDDSVDMDLNPYVEDIPWAKTIGALVSYTEIMVRNECFEKMVGNGQNWGQVASNFLGVVQMVSMATTPIEPTMASVAVASRLGTVLFSAIGAIQQAIEERSRSVHPLMFSTKMCGLRKYLLNRQRAACLSNCADSLESANQALKDQMCSTCLTTVANNQFESLSQTYSGYSNLLDQISKFELQSSDQLLSPEQKQLTENFVSTINQDRNLLASKLGYNSATDFIDRYLDVTDENDPRFSWLEYAKPTTTIGEQKNDINLIMGIPGLILKDHLCDDSDRKILEDPFFSQYMLFSDSNADSFCETLATYHECGARDGWRDSTQEKCQEERERLLDENYSPLKGTPYRNFMNALQVQKLTQEAKSNNSACFSVEHCEKNRYNCMALLATYDGSTSCGSLAGMTADSRQLQYLQKVKDFNYMKFHRNHLQQEIDSIEESSDYQRYLNLKFAQDELQKLLETVTTQNSYNECMEGHRQHEMEKECFGEYVSMKAVAMRTINECIFGEAEQNAGNEYADTSWKDFFKTSFSDGNLNSTVRRVLKAKKDPWEALKSENAEPMTQEQMDTMAQALCKTLYCPLKNLDSQEVGFNLFDIYTWFGGENPPVIRHSNEIRRMIRNWCEPRLGHNAVERLKFMECSETECRTIVQGVYENYFGPDNQPLDLRQCLPTQ